MATILCIETATEVCSVALAQDGEVLMERVSDEDQSHSTLLGVYVEELMEYVRANNLALDAVAVSSGPGSYTGLRIGVSEAKGLSYGLNVPLIAIPTHEIMAWQMKDEAVESMLLCPMIDARRMEVYTTFFDSELNIVRETKADIIDEDSYADLLEEHEILFFGNGAAKCKETITHGNARFVDNIKPVAAGMVAAAEKAYEDKRFEDVAYFEPFYLKQFVATMAKNKVINI